jgi:uncharacterized protein involved in type VI secretion and phage assembly
MGMMDTLERILGGNSVPSDRMFGVATGIVRENWNSDYPGMVKVEYFVGTKGKSLTGWVPVMSSYAGKNYGCYALPEVGAQVVIAFNRGDYSRPIVLGSLWNGANPLPAKTAAKNNPVKRMKTKGGCEILLQDEDKKQKVQLTTPGKLSVLLDDENSSVTLKDGNGKNTVVVNSKKGTVVVTAEKKLTFALGSSTVVSVDSGGVSIKAGSIKIEASQSLELKGQNSTYSGGMVKISGSSSLEASSGGMAQLKGAMVKIN